MEEFKKMCVDIFLGGGGACTMCHSQISDVNNKYLLIDLHHICLYKRKRERRKKIK